MRFSNGNKFVSIGSSGNSCLCHRGHLWPFSSCFVPPTADLLPLMATLALKATRQHPVSRRARQVRWLRASLLWRIYSDSLLLMAAARWQSVCPLPEGAPKGPLEQPPRPESLRVLKNRGIIWVQFSNVVRYVRLFGGR